MKLDPILARGTKLVRSGKYETAIRTLEPEVNRYHGSFRYYYLLGSSCLRTGDFGGALTYFRLAHDAKRRDPLAILGLAALYLRRSETDRAVDYYLDVLEIDHKNRIAKKAMKVIRKHAGTDAFSAWLEAGRLPTLYPPVPFPGFSKKEMLVFFAALVAAGIIAFGLLVRYGIFDNPFNPGGDREGVAAFTLTREDRMESVQTGGTYKYELTRSEALDLHYKAQSMFNANRDDAARINLNKILASNASEGLKNRARIIIPYLKAPDIIAFNKNDNTTYSEARNNLILYNEVHVIWQGRARNMRLNNTTFDLIVENDNLGSFEGFVPVVFSHAVPINTERPLEVLGQIILDDSEIGFYLKGVNYKQSALLEN